MGWSCTSSFAANFKLDHNYCFCVIVSSSTCSMLFRQFAGAFVCSCCACMLPIPLARLIINGIGLMQIMSSSHGHVRSKQRVHAGSEAPPQRWTLLRNDLLTTPSTVLVTRCSLKMRSCCLSFIWHCKPSRWTMAWG